MAFFLKAGLRETDPMKKIFLVLLLLAATVSLCGCGETISGVGKDASRMGKGVSTFFFRQ